MHNEDTLSKPRNGKRVCEFRQVTERVIDIPNREENSRNNMAGQS